MTGKVSGMLTISSARFCHELKHVSGQLSYSGEYDTLSFKEFPAYVEAIYVAIDCQVSEGVEGDIAFRVRLHDQVIREVGRTTFRLHQEGRRRNFSFVATLTDVLFPSPGYYMFDILFGGVLLQCVPLSILQSP
jgi:hypothetical protein